MDAWTRDFEAAKDLANDTLSLITERNTKYPSGGPDASRITAAARRKLGTLGSLVDALRAALEGPACAALSEAERNRRRDLAAALRGRREQMLAALKRDAAGGAPAAARDALLGGGAARGAAARGAAAGRETDATAELDAPALLRAQQQVMAGQDRELEALERSVGATKHVALQINEEASLHVRLLEGLDADVDATGARLAAAQRHLRHVLQRSGSCKTKALLLVLLVTLVVVLGIALKAAIRWGAP